jgi:NAD(P)-dependent dehydrogenase (short-subunit alcohol dehydrogenase family)
MSPYIASKHGVIGLTRAAALEYARANVRVNAVCPSFIQTPMVEQVSLLLPDLREASVNYQPIGRMGTPEEMVLRLRSDATSFVTGHSMIVDGGVMAS